MADKMHYSSHFLIRDTVIQSYGYCPYIQVKYFSNKFGDLFKVSCQYGSVSAYRHGDKSLVFMWVGMLHS